MSLEVLITDAFAGEAVARLAAEINCRVRTGAGPTPSAQELENADALLIRSRTKINAELLTQAPRLKFIATATSGFDHIDIAACQARGIALAYTPDANAASAAELTLALILNLRRKVLAANRSLYANTWRGQELRGHSLDGQTLGIIGLGRIGRRVARAATALNMKVIAHDPYVDDDVFTAARAGRRGLSELLVEADIVSLHVPLTRETRHLINHATLGLMQRHAVLVNTARGALVDEDEVAQAIQEGRLAGAGLDVFEREPLIKESRLRSLHEVVLTPHIGAFTHEAILAASHEAVEAVVAHFSGRKVKNPLPPDTRFQYL